MIAIAGGIVTTSENVDDATAAFVEQLQDEARQVCSFVVQAYYLGAWAAALAEDPNAIREGFNLDAPAESGSVVICYRTAYALTLIVQSGNGLHDVSRWAENGAPFLGRWRLDDLMESTTERHRRRWAASVVRNLEDAARESRLHNLPAERYVVSNPFVRRDTGPPVQRDCARSAFGMIWIFQLLARDGEFRNVSSPADPSSGRGLWESWVTRLREAVVRQHRAQIEWKRGKTERERLAKLTPKARYDEWRAQQDRVAR
jgi:hypothetical protein